MPPVSAAPTRARAPRRAPTKPPPAAPATPSASPATDAARSWPPPTWPIKITASGGSTTTSSLQTPKAPPPAETAGAPPAAPSTSPWARPAEAPRSPRPAPIPPPPAASGVRSAEEQFSIPTGYGDHRIVLMVKDPWWLLAYWEIQGHIERQVRSQLAPEEIPGLQTVLRVYDVTDLPSVTGGSPGQFPEQPNHRLFDVPLSGQAMSWYLHTNSPNRSFIVDIGLLTRRGRFLPLARSNRVTAPRFGPSEIIDEQWMSADDVYWRLYGMTAGLGAGSSMSGMRAGLERLLSSPMFSPGGYFTPQKPTTRSFWLVVDAELIVYGATDPKAAVTIQGRPIQLRPDGTFSVRMALPDGTQTVPVEAISPDGQELRAIIPIVTRRTESRRSGPSGVGR